MGLGPDLSTIKIGSIRLAVLQFGQAGATTSDLGDQLSGIHGRTMPSWTGPASLGFSGQISMRIQAKPRRGPTSSDL